MTVGITYIKQFEMRHQIGDILTLIGGLKEMKTGPKRAYRTVLYCVRKIICRVKDFAVTVDSSTKSVPVGKFYCKVTVDSL